MTPSTHVNIGQQYPGSYEALLALHNQTEANAVDAGLDRRLVELIKVRASQLNGCAFCLRMHTRDATEAGESLDRLAVVAAWWESQYFTGLERAALQITEQVTLISDHGRLPDRQVDPEQFLDAKQIAAVTWLANVINVWNRVAICSHYPVAP